MMDPIPDDLAKDMSPTEAIREQSPPSVHEIQADLQDKHVCPFCGAVRRDPQQPCPRCTMEDTPATRQATKARIGPWHVLQSRNPSAPGMKFATLLSLVKKGQVTPRSIVRGPTTHQLWKFAARVKGLSRAFGLCYGCGEQIEPSVNICPHCQRLQEPPMNPDLLLETAGERPAPRRLPAANPSDLVLPPAPLPSQAIVPAPRSRPAPAPQFPNPPDTAEGEDAILSAKELAAAFKLEFAPPGQRRGRHRLAKVALLLFGLALIAGAAALYWQPPWREKTLNWAKQAYQSIQGAFATPLPLPGPMAPGVSSSPEQPPQVIPTLRPARATTRPDQRASEDPAAPSPADLAVAADLARTLWRNAIDAEQRRDFRDAVKSYEQIKTLPSDVWPSSLDLRLEAARQQSR